MSSSSSSSSASSLPKQKSTSTSSSSSSSQQTSDPVLSTSAPSHSTASSTQPHPAAAVPSLSRVLETKRDQDSTGAISTQGQAWWKKRKAAEIGTSRFGVKKKRGGSKRGSKNGKKLNNKTQFKYTDLRYEDYFATVGSNYASVYRLDNNSITPVCIFQDQDSTEKWFSCCWSIDVDTGHPLLIVGGNNGIIKILNCHTHLVEKVLLGHGASIYDLSTHPQDPSILLSASQDASARLWNIHSGRMFASFLGEQGHREAVLSAAFNLSGDLMITSGMDHMIKIWDLTELKEEMKLSHFPANYPISLTNNPSSLNNPINLPVRVIQFPLFSTSKVHTNYVDCVRFMGEWILSKSAGNRIVLWRLRDTEEGGYSVDRIQEYVFQDSDIWFVRFSQDYSQRLLAVGNNIGDMFVWDTEQSLLKSLQQRGPYNPHGFKLNPKQPQAKHTIRHVAFSRDGSVLLGGCEDGHIFRYDVEGRADRVDRARATTTATSASVASVAPAP